MCNLLTTLLSITSIFFFVSAGLLFLVCLVFVLFHKKNQ
jgi:hypothetical protein